MTDNDKACDAAIQQIEKSLAGRPLSSFEQLLICRGWNAAVAHAEAQHAERVKALNDQLQHNIDAIETLPQDVFGIGGEGQTHWYIRDELIGRAKEVLRGKDD